MVAEAVEVAAVAVAAAGKPTGSLDSTPV